MTGKYQTYSKYDAAGDDCWFGCVPSHWEVKKISYVAQLKSGDSIVSEQIEAEGDYPVYGGNGHRGYTSKFNHEGDYILIGRQGALCGNINYTSGQFWASEHAVVVHPTVKVSLKWLGETLRAMDLNQYNVSAAQPGLAVANITCLKIPYPNIVEQENIASFLDHETAKIDTLIEKQQQLIQLLKEKRQAVISHAVTKGLNPNAPVRDSGVEWLGQVPEHWEVKKLKYLGRAQNGLTYSPVDVVDENEGILVLRASNIQGGKLSFVDNVYVDAKPANRMITQENDILICSRSGSRALIGKNALIPKKYAGLTYGAFMMVFRSESNPYLYWVLNSSLFDYQSGSFLTSTINQLTVGNMESFEVPLPPTISEQNSIIEFLKSESASFSKAIRLASLQVELLQERRTALISAAVTGKIDVRHPVCHPTGDLQSSKSTVHGDL